MTSGVSFESGKRVLRVLNKPTLPFNSPLAAYACPCAMCAGQENRPPTPYFTP